LTPTQINASNFEAAAVLAIGYICLLLRRAEIRQLPTWA